LLRFGVKAGGNSANFKFDAINSPDAILSEASEAQWGFHAGVFLRINLAILYIEPEVYFTSTGGKYTYNDPNASVGDELKSFNMNRVDVPVLVGVKLGPFRINAGPSASIILSHSSNLDDIKADVKGATWGYQAGIGFDLFKKLTIDARYEGNLSALGENINIAGTDFPTDMRTSQFLISVGWMFGSNNK
jgi:opacity protein-like surface antigen